MSWHFSRVQVEEFSQVNSLGIESFAPSRTMLTPQGYCCSAKMIKSLPRSRYGMTLEHLMEESGEVLLTWFREDSLAKVSPLPAKGQGYKREQGQDCGLSFQGLLEKSKQSGFGLKTLPSLSDGEWVLSSLTFPKWGTMRNGVYWEVETLEGQASERECGFLPTPTSTDWKRTPMKTNYAYRPMTRGTSDTLAQWAVRESGLPHARLVPDLWEWVLSWPLMWTGLEPLVMVKYLSWRLRHLRCL